MITVLHFWRLNKLAYEQKDGSGALFRNDKRGNERAPDYRGDANVNGELVEIAAWIKEGKNGKFMSLSFKPKGDRPAPANNDVDDDIPF